MIETIHPIPAFNDNYIWALIDSDAGQVCVVDPGDATPVISYLEQNKLELSQILITHHHPDHTGGLPTLTERFGVEVYGPDNPSIRGISKPLREGDKIPVLGVEFSVLEVPGHTLDHIAYFSDASETEILFCGDTLFAAGCGRLFEGTPEQMHQSLSALAKLPEQTRVYCTHEYTLANLQFALAADPENKALHTRNEEAKKLRSDDIPTLPSTIAVELATNPFLRCDQPAVQSRVGAHRGESMTDVTETFAALRQWKDNF